MRAPLLRAVYAHKVVFQVPLSELRPFRVGPAEDRRVRLDVVLRDAVGTVMAARRGAALQDAAAADPVRRQGAYQLAHPDAVAQDVAACSRAAPQVSAQPDRQARRDVVRRELQDAFPLETSALQLLVAAPLTPQAEQARQLALSDESESQGAA